MNIIITIHKKIIGNYSNTMNSSLFANTSTEGQKESEDEKFTVNYTKYSEKNFHRWIESLLTHRQIKSIQTFRSGVTDKEEDLELIPIKERLPHLGDIDMKLINKVPKRETKIMHLLKIGFYGLLSFPFSFETKSVIPYDQINHYYKDVITVLSDSLNKNVLKYTEDVESLHGTIMDPKIIPIQGPFIQIMEYDEVEKLYVIDFMYLKDYEYRKTLKRIPFKAYYKPNEEKTMDLVKFEYLKITEQGPVIKKLRPPFTMNIYRHINSSMIAKKTIIYHLFITHLEVSQSFSYCVRKFLSQSNPLKTYLMHFADGTLRVNAIYIQQLLAAYGSAFAAFPFTRKSFNGLCKNVADSFSTNPSQYRKIINPLTDKTYHQLKRDGVKTLTQDDACNLFGIIEKNVNLALDELDFLLKDYVDEMKEFETEMRKNCRLYYETDSLRDILTMAIYVGSVYHEIVGNMIANYYPNPQFVSASMVEGENQTDENPGISESSFFNTMTILFGANVGGKMLMDIEYLTNNQIKNILYQMVSDLTKFEETINQGEIVSVAIRVLPSRLESGVQV